MYRFSFPTPIFFGAKTRFNVDEHLKAKEIKNPLIVTDKGFAELPIFKDFAAKIENSKTFSKIWGNPTKSQVIAGVDAFKLAKCDAIVGIGGGAALDVAKAIALMIHHPGDLFDYEDDKPGSLPIDKEIPYFVALPTTSGTGSEVGRSAVVSDDSTHIKKIIFSPRLLAQAVFADPEFTFDLPHKITATTGMDALTHCVESFLAKGFHPICDGIALEGLRLAAENIETCIKEPHNLEARSAMMMSSMMGAIAFQKGLGVTHSCAHALSTVADLHHGLANGIMINFALKDNVKAVPERFARMCQTVGIGTDANSFIPWLEELKEKLDVPSTLTKAGVKKEQLQQLVEIALADGCHQSNPKPCSREDFVRIFSEAF